MVDEAFLRMRDSFPMSCLTNSSLFARVRVAAAVVAVFALAGCMEDQDIAKHLRPLSYATLADLKAHGMTKDAPILIRIFKDESELEVWKKASTGRFEKFKTYDICAWSGELGPKKQEGDRQAPEGFYTITPAQMNPNSNYYLSFNIGFPNTFDRAYGRTGKFLMVHGACSSAGCYAMTDEQIQEIYALARDAFRGGQRSFQVQALPFRMTPENMAKHADNPNMPFWRNLKQGVDHFEVTGVPPEVGVCDKKYVFDATPAAGQRMDPIAVCPKLEVPEQIRVAVAQKEMKDDMAFQVALADIRAKEAGETKPSDGGLISRIMVAGRSVPVEPQGDAEDYSEPAAAPQQTQVATAEPAQPAAPVAANPSPNATAMAPVEAGAGATGSEPFANVVTGVWGRIVDMARGGLDGPEAAAGAEADPIQTGSVPGEPALEQPTPLSRAFAPPSLFPSNPFRVFDMFATVDGVSVPADTVQR